MLLLKAMIGITPLLRLRLQNYQRQGDLDATVEIIEYGRPN